MHTSRCEFEVESLESRRMLTTVSVTGATIKINGTNDADFLEIYESEGTVVVFDGEVAQSTGIASDDIDRLIVNLRDGDDSVFVGSGLRVNKVTTIKLGNGNNSADVAGVHANIKVLGGKGTDDVDINGVVPLKKAVANLKGGDDELKFSVDGFADAIDGGVIDEDEALELLEKPPRISLILGAGDDLLAITSGGAPISGDFIDDLLADFGYDSLEELIEELEGLADAEGLGDILKVLKVNGGSGNDVFHPAGISSLLGIFGAKINNFELEGIGNRLMPT